MTTTLTPTQQTILQLIADRVESEGVPPSQTEIARALGFRGVRGAQYHLEILEQAGAIKRIPGQTRGIRLVQPVPSAAPPDADLRAPTASPAPSPARQDDDVLRLPVLGRVAAGTPIGADIDGDEVVL